MTEKFVYAPFGDQPEGEMWPAPLWPEGNPEGQWSRRMMDVKARNDENFWNEMREVIGHDVQTLPMHRFKVWTSILAVPLVSRHKFQHYITRVLGAVDRDPALLEVLRDPGIGTVPEDMIKLLGLFDDFPATMNRVQCMAHLINTGWLYKVKDVKTIMEFGAGIGEMTDVIYKLGFNGQYSIYDFPELHAIQKYHHQALGLQGVEYVTEQNLKPGTWDLGIATFSLTEMPFALRDKLLETVNCDNWIISYSKQIFGYDNDKWMREVFAPRFKEHTVRFIDKPYHQFDGGSFYLVIEKDK